MRICVGVSSRLNIWMDDEARETFGDGPWAISAERPDGGALRFTLSLASRGSILGKNSITGDWQMGIALSNVKGWRKKFPLFTKTQAAIHRSSSGVGVDLVMPTTLTLPRARGAMRDLILRGRAKTDTSDMFAHHLKVRPSTASVLREPETIKTSPSLRDLVQQLNSLKRELGSELVLSIAEDGTLRAMVEYGG